MTDLELTKACAEAMGTQVTQSTDGLGGVHFWLAGDTAGSILPYDPLHDDAQAMALVKKFELSINYRFDGDWLAQWFGPHEQEIEVETHGLNRAICECVAQLKAL